MKWTTTLAALGLIAVGGQASAALFSEDFNDGNAASRWSIVSQQEDRPDVLAPDGSVDFNFDYSTLGIPSAPNGAGTTGVYLQFNKTDQVGNEGESYSIYPNGQSFTGMFQLRLDMFVYNDGGSGTTEHGMAGIYLDNGNPVSPYEFGTAGGPLAWTYSGEGGDGTGDLGRFSEGDATNTGYFPLGDYADQTTLPPGFSTDFGPATDPTGAVNSGAWVDVIVRTDGTTVEWLLNGVVMDTYDNSGGFYTAGNILVGGMDVFNSSNGNIGVVVDNITVTVPEPATALLAVAALAGLTLRRRNG